MAKLNISLQWKYWLDDQEELEFSIGKYDYQVTRVGRVLYNPENPGGNWIAVNLNLDKKTFKEEMVAKKWVKDCFTNQLTNSIL